MFGLPAVRTFFYANVLQEPNVRTVMSKRSQDGHHLARARRGLVLNM
jgi:hypothetical protein